MLFLSKLLNHGTSTFNYIWGVNRVRKGNNVFDLKPVNLIRLFRLV
jgi:hypothetical protein